MRNSTRNNDSRNTSHAIINARVHTSICAQPMAVNISSLRNFTSAVKKDFPEKFGKVARHYCDLQMGKHMGKHMACWVECMDDRQPTLETTLFMVWNE